jgi:hypothetical protein
MKISGFILLINTFIVHVNYDKILFPQIPASGTVPASKAIQVFTPSPSFEHIAAVELTQASEEVPTSTPVPASKQIPAFEPIPVFAPAQFFEPIPVVEPVPVYEVAPVEALDTTNERESAPTCEFHWWSIPEGEQNFWWILVLSSLFFISILLVMLQHFQQCWHGEYKREQKRTQLPRNLQVSESFVQEVRATMALLQEAQDEEYAQLQTEMESVKEAMKVKERRFAELQNVIDLMKTMIKVQNEHVAQLQNQMGLMEKVMKAEDKRCAQIQEEMHSMKMVGDGWVSVSAEQIVGDPASLERSCQDEDAKEIVHCSFQHCSREKKKLPVLAFRT